MHEERNKKSIRILGTRGIPACHGGFETFAEGFSKYLVANGWNVSVYCQETGHGKIREEDWNGIKRIIVPVAKDSSLGSIFFDLKSVIHAASSPELCLTLGYNTAIFNILLRLKGIKTIMNMDGIEWSRAKWSWPARVWLYLNEWIGARVSNVLVADHPEIAKHLERHTRASKIVMIPYGAEAPESPQESVLKQYGVLPHEYALVIARPEPENSILEIVTAWSMEKRNFKLIVVGNYDKSNPYHRKVLDAASDEVIFAGAIYDKNVVGSLRWFAAFYIHGHQVGGTNPSLVESLACGNPILAHDNRFNRWVAGNGMLYFSNATECAEALAKAIENPHILVGMCALAKEKHNSFFSNEKIWEAYEGILKA